MKQARLTRILTHPEHGTFGVLVLDAVPFCVTLEPYARDNQQGVSCVPTGQYVGEPFRSPQFGSVYLLKDIAGRDLIELHAGNRDDNTRGCILLAQHFGKLAGDLAVLNSGNTFRKFMQYMSHDELFLTIQEAL